MRREADRMGLVPMQKIGSYTFEEYCERVRAFHGALARGFSSAGS